MAVHSLLAQFAPVAPESPNAEGIRDSWLFVSIFVGAIFLLVEGLLVAFIWKYRRQKRGRFEDAAQVHGATKLELAWTAGPVVVLFLIAAFVFAELPGIKDVPEAAAGEERLEVRGRRAGSTTGSTSIRTASSRSTPCAHRSACPSASR